ncbi:MAG: undecaprenyl-phosphate galactose phosphotransferase WbaP [Treponema sp.]|jgi:Undecaprenyl-phosphate galactose phosphotransferase WbaP|nr:undecaprenyl-phosphate galactose phosphotransferase WbaP [Treponema sp.]
MDIREFENWYSRRYNRTSSAFISTALVLSDLFGIMLSFGTSFFLVNLYDISAINFKSFVTYWPYLPVFIIFFQANGLYPGIALAPSEELRHFTVSSVLAHGGIIFSRYIEDQEFDAISIAFIISFLCSPVILILMREMMFNILSWTKLGKIPAVIYGSGPTGHLVIDRLLDSRRIGYTPVLILDNKPEERAVFDDAYRGVPVIHDTSIGPEIVSRFRIRMAFVAMPELSGDDLSHLLNYSVSAFRYSVFIPTFFNVTNIWMSVRDFDGVLGLVTSHKLKMSWNLAMKRFMDLSFVIIGGMVILPLLLLIALLVKLSSPGPVLYGHQRLGRNRRYFIAYKFRSMVNNSQEVLKNLLNETPELRREWESNHKLKNDPRITAIGKFLRRTSFDEFPQLINILKGDMSLVGPRPVVEAEVEKYGKNFDYIFSVKPGLTGLWQVSGRSDTDYTDRIAFDTYYLQSWSVWLDLWVLLKTIGVVIKGKGAY